MPTRNQSRQVEILRLNPTTNALQPHLDHIAIEEPLEIRVQGQSIAITMRTPGYDRELAAGFLASEAVIKSPADILAIAPCTQGEAALHGNILNVFLSPKVEFDPATLARHVFGSSSCGLCGKATIDSIRQRFPPITTPPPFPWSAIPEMPTTLRKGQKLFNQTGAVHGAALLNWKGETVVIHEDVGRHNAVDKVIGSQLLANHWPLTNHILVVSGRASFEIVQKALAAGIPAVVAVSAPSTLAIELARENNQLLIGFLRAPQYNCYSHPEWADRFHSR